MTRKDNVKVVSDLITGTKMSQKEISEKTGIGLSSVYKILKYKLKNVVSTGKNKEKVFSLETVKTE